MTRSEIDSPVTVPSGTTSYTYDALNRIATVTDPDSNLTEYSYDEVGNLVRTAFPNGVSEIRQYDALDRLVLVETADSSDVLASFEYELDATGRRTAVDEHDGRRVEFVYDDIYRLVEEKIFDAGATDVTRSIEYTYDAVGNRLARNDSADGLTTYEYDANDRLLLETLASDETRYIYDDNGNQLSKLTATEQAFYNWDFDNRLVSADTDGDGTNDVQYQYDADGIRVAETVGGEETRLLVDKNRLFPQVVEEYTPGGVIKASLIHGHDLISQTRGGEQIFYHVDGLGSVRALTDAVGAVLSRYGYDAFGRMISQSGTTPNVHLFTGERFDSELGMNYLRARYYDLSTGRFASVDPFEGLPLAPMTLHDYLYVNADPANFVDPTGMYTLGDLAIAGSITFVLVTLAGVSFGMPLDQAAILGGVAALVVVGGGIWIGGGLSIVATAGGIPLIGTSGAISVAAAQGTWVAPILSVSATAANNAMKAMKFGRHFMFLLPFLTDEDTALSTPKRPK